VSHEDAAEVQRWALSESIAQRFSATRVGSAVVAALTRTRRGLVSELLLTTEDDDVPTDCVVNFNNLHTLPRATSTTQPPAATVTTSWLAFAPAGTEATAAV